MNKSVTLIGNGKMALALAKGLCEHYALEIIGRSVESLERFEKNLGTSLKKTLYSSADITDKIIILCVKPSNLDDITPDLKGKARVLYSVLAGIELKKLHCIPAGNYCRAMPNLAAEIGTSMTSLVGDNALIGESQRLFSMIGSTIWLNSEKELDIATALAGSGPAYLALISEAFCDGAVREGLKRDDAMTLMRGLFMGYGKLIQNIHPALLKDAVMSPGGTTAAGYEALETYGVRKGCIEAIHAAHVRAKEMK